MGWLKRLFQKLFKKNEIKFIEESKNIKDLEGSHSDFIFNLKRSANLERDDGNGYKIIPYIKLKDMI